jgi:hypothetical protein
MSELEFLEVFATLIDVSLSNMGLYATAVSGYLITAYLVGEKLNRTQFLIVSSLFVVFALLTTASGFALTERAIQLEIKFEGERDALDFASFIIAGAQLLGILAALKFMWDVRNPSKRDSTRA